MEGYSSVFSSKYFLLFFLWRLSQYLAHFKKLNAKRRCPCCKLNEERMSHVFYNCDISKELWYVLQNHLQKIPPPIQDMKAFIHSLSNNPHPNDIRLIAVSLSKIWTAQTVFWIENKNDSLGIIMQSILNYVEELIGLEESIFDVPWQILHHWQPPNYWQSQEFDFFFMRGGGQKKNMMIIFFFLYIYNS